MAKQVEINIGFFDGTKEFFVAHDVEPDVHNLTNEAGDVTQIQI